MKQRASLLQRSRDAENVVARHGVAAWLVLLCALLMSFLSIYTTTLSGIAHSLSSSWRETLTESATLRVPAELITEDTDAIADNILSTTPGIIDHKQLSDEEQIALIAPWLGNDIPQDVIALPRIYTTTIDPKVLDIEGLKLRLTGELKGGVWDDHQRWRGPLLDSANRLKWLSWVSTAIVASAFIFLIFVSAEASIYSNAKSIELLRQIGAEDQWILNGFLRKFVLRCVMGAILGVLIGILATYGLLSNNVSNASLLNNVSLTSIQIPRAIFIVIAAGALGYASTYTATLRYLNRIS